MDVAQKILTAKRAARNKKPVVPLQIKWRKSEIATKDFGSTRNVPPFIAQILAFLSSVTSRERQIYLHLPGIIPKTLNHQYGRGANGGSYLIKEAKELRDIAQWEAIRQNHKCWAPRGAVAAVVGLYSPDEWVTSGGLIRESDCDNRLKPALDAAQKAIPAFQDHQVWFSMAFKCASNEKFTGIWLFDTGNVVSGFNFR